MRVSIPAVRLITYVIEGMQKCRENVILLQKYVVV